MLVADEIKWAGSGMGVIVVPTRASKGSMMVAPRGMARIMRMIR